MRRLAGVLTLVVLWLSPSRVQAQLPDLASVAAQYLPPAELESRTPAKAQVTSYDASLNAPIPIDSHTFLIPGLAYHLDSLSYSDTPPAFTEPRAFHSLEMPLLMVQLLPNDWALSFRVSPALAGDFRGFDAGLFHLSALALGTHSLSKRFALGGRSDRHLRLRFAALSPCCVCGVETARQSSSPGLRSGARKREIHVFEKR